MNSGRQLSPAFSHFLTRLHATGREKQDGFFPADFQQMSTAERVDARALLQEATREGDDIAAHGLVLLDGPDAVPVLREALPTAYRAPTTPRVRVLGLLWRLTGDRTYSDALAALIGDTQGVDAIDRQVALVQLANSQASPAVLAALWRAVREEPASETVRFLAAKQLLYAGGLIADVHERNYPEKHIVVEVAEATGQRRVAATHQLERVLAPTPAAPQAGGAPH